MTQSFMSLRNTGQMSSEVLTIEALVIAKSVYTVSGMTYSRRFSLSVFVGVQVSMNILRNL